MPFKNLFRSSAKTTDGLTQAAREAIVDVLHYCMYADKHIAAREDEFIEAAARNFDWDPNISYEYYEVKSTGDVTRAISDADAEKAFFATLLSRLPRPADRKLALTLAADLAKADGETVPAEAAAIARLRLALA
jgi:uncharacterized tellurite resistance protein B-like protein